MGLYSAWAGEEERRGTGRNSERREKRKRDQDEGREERGGKNEGRHPSHEVSEKEC